MNWDEHSDPTGSVPSAEDEYLASLEPEPDYTGDLILALSTLTEKQRFVIECRYGMRGDSMTVCEIATLMGISHPSVVRLEQRAMRSLRRGVQKTPISSGFFANEKGAPQRSPLASE